MKKIGLLSLLLVLLASSVNAQSARRYFKTGEDFMESGKYEDAIEQFNNALKVNPDYNKAFEARAVAYEKTGDLEKAIEDWERAIVFDNKETEYYYNIGRLQYELENYKKSVSSLERAIDVKKTNMVAYQYLVKSQIELEDYNKALENINTALLLKENGVNFYLRGLIMEALNEPENAIKDFERSIRKNKAMIASHVALSRLKLNKANLPEALEHANDALEVDANSREGLLQRSMVYVKLRDYPKAINDISTLILNNPDDPLLYIQRGKYYQEFTQHQNAINDFNRALLIDDQNADALYQRAWSYEQVANYQAAIKDYEKLTSLSEYDIKARKLLDQAQARLFELMRESDAPEVAILDPKTRGNQQVEIPKRSSEVNIKGVVKDDSDLKFLKINDKEVPFVKNENGFEFLVTISVANTSNFTLEVADVYDNVETINYNLVFTEIDAPDVKILAPYASDDGQVYLDSNDPRLYVEGKISDESLIESIMINGVSASYIPDEINPVFSATIDILNKNSFTVQAKDIYGNVTEAEFRLNRETADMLENNPMGKTWAVFIENSNYETFASLDGPSKDVSLMKAALANYQINNIIHKKDMTKQDLEKFFSIELRDLIRSNRVNSILIWYAGHGKFINESGYWVPVDASRDDEFTYFNINQLKASLQSYSNYITHTLVITDACESGPSFYQAMRSGPDENKSCNDWQTTRFKSSQVLSSAGYELAVDNSQFTRTFANSLANNPDACIPIDKIVSNVTTAVVRNNQQKPQFGKISGLEDENGTFFFISKDY